MKIIKRDEIIDEDRGGYFIKRLLTQIFKEAPLNAGFYETTIPKGSKCKEQWHKKSYEAVYFLTSGVAKLNGKEYKFSSGDLVVLEPNEKHEWLAIENEVKMFAMRFPNLLDDKYTAKEEKNATKK